MNPSFQNGGFDPSAPHDDFIDQIIQWPAFDFADESMLPYDPIGSGGFTDESASESRQQQIGQNNDEFHRSFQALYSELAAAAFLAGGNGDPSRSNRLLHLEVKNQNLGAADAWLNVVQGQRAQAPPRSTASATAASAPAQSKPRVRARRGQATDPHSIAERLRREKISERMKALQQLVPTANKTDKGSMVDEIVDYVKFLQLQVKLLSMSRMSGGAAAAAASLAFEDDSGSETTSSGADNSLTVSEKEVAKLMEEDMGTAMQYLQGKGLCLIPISAAVPHVSPTRLQ